ncbi:MAG: class A beta-lactamase-related serine hydrolase [Ignavibacteriales bacterium]|nr:class A beta-lactamase-related serine hydrolase [Ignavibacteriales bacterium]
MDENAQEGPMRKILSAVAILGLAVAAGLPAAAQSRFPALLDAKLLAGVREVEAGLDGVLGLALKDLKTGRTILVNEREVFPQASSIKIAILFEMFKQAEEGRLDLDGFLTVDESNKVAGSGVLYYLGRPSLKLVDPRHGRPDGRPVGQHGHEPAHRKGRPGGREPAPGRPGARQDPAAAEDDGSQGRRRRPGERLHALEMMTLLERIWKGGILKDPYRKDLLDMLAIPKDSPLRRGRARGRRGGREARGARGGPVRFGDRHALRPALCPLRHDDVPEAGRRRQPGHRPDLAARLRALLAARAARATYGRIVSDK